MLHWLKPIAGEIPPPVKRYFEQCPAPVQIDQLWRSYTHTRILFSLVPLLHHPTQQPSSISCLSLNQLVADLSWTSHAAMQLWLSPLNLYSPLSLSGLRPLWTPLNSREEMQTRVVFRATADFTCSTPSSGEVGFKISTGWEKAWWSDRWNSELVDKKKQISPNFQLTFLFKIILHAFLQFCLCGDISDLISSASDKMTLKNVYNCTLNICMEDK